MHGLKKRLGKKDPTNLWKVPLRIQVRFLIVKKCRGCFRIAPHLPSMNTTHAHKKFPQFKSWAAHFCPFLVPLATSFQQMSYFSSRRLNRSFRARGTVLHHHLCKPGRLNCLASLFDIFGWVFLLPENRRPASY